jgi:S-formylglutathione hydrolase FrmB
VRYHISHLSLIHGCVPVVVQIVAAVVLTCAVGWRARRWRMRWFAWALIGGALTAIGARWYIASAGIAGGAPPASLWIWIGLSGLTVGILVLGWPSAPWWRRGLSALSVPLSVLSAALVLNLWVGYFPTLHSVWTQLTSGPLPDQVDRSTVTAMQLEGARPDHGAVVPVTISADGSGFKHRQEFVYLPPAWFATNPPPRLPVVMMIGAEFNTPSDWVRAGNAIVTVDRFAALHRGNAPVLVFTDTGGAFDVDTECVNGSRGNAADHLTKDVVPFITSNFGASADRRQWGVAGFSAGGTCAVDLAVMHPEMFSAFVDIAGDLGPNTGTKEQTIARLFGGRSDAWANFDPATVIGRHQQYAGLSGYFAFVASPGHGSDPRDAEGQAAHTLCGLAAAKGISCTLMPLPGTHDWPFAGTAFAVSLPWLAAQLGTPGVPMAPSHPSSATSPVASSTQAAVGPAQVGS